uniref:Variable large protein n=1 Tax=Panagrolaimus davidi TaxID=227884 RepID=A0A914RDQ6_9BILA
MSQSSDLSGIVGVMFIDNFTSLVQALGDSAVNVSGLISNLPAATAVTVAAALKKTLKESDKSITKQDLLGIAMAIFKEEEEQYVIESNNETLKLQADVHIKNLKAACGYKTGSEFGKMLRSTAKSIIEGLQNIKNGNPGCFEKFEATKTDAKLKIKAFSNSRDILVAQNEGDSENFGGKNKLFESDTLKAKRSEERQTLMKARLRCAWIFQSSQIALILVLKDRAHPYDG